MAHALLRAASALLPTLVLVAQSRGQTLLDRISRLAASEPVEYGIDTRLKLAEALKPKYPEKAKRQLHDAEASLPGVPDMPARNMWRVRIVQALAHLDYAEAERLAKSIGPDRRDDYLADAYDHLYASRGKRDGGELIQKAIAAGAFRLQCAAKWLGELKRTAPGEALALFEEISNAFPDPPDARDIEYLKERAKEMEMFDSEAVRAAERKAMAATEPSAEAKKSSPEAKKDEEASPDISKLPYADALELVSKLKAPGDGAGALIELSRREDFSRQQQARIASEALSALGKMKISEDRLVGLSMLSRDFVKRQEYSSAALTAQMLSETFAKGCDCRAARCQVDDEKFDCISLINDFAEYLHELNISQESMGLQNISLEARLLIFELGIRRP